MEDQRIIELLWQRLESGIDALRAKFGRGIDRIAMNILADPDDAEEVANDTYLALWNAIPPAKPDPLSAFVYKVCRNTALNRLRSHQAQKRSGYEVSLEELSQVLPGDTLEGHIDTRALGRCIDRFLETLDPQSRCLFLRRYWYGDSLKELAARQHLTPGTLSVRLHRIRGKLKDYLNKEGFWYET